MKKLPTSLLVAMTLCSFLALVTVNSVAEPQKNTEQANVPTENALASTGADRQGSVTHTLPPVADAAAAASFRKNRPADFWVFGERREKPVCRRDAVPASWLNQPELHLARFDGTAQPGEFYVFQLGVWAGERDLERVTLEFSGLKGQTGTIPADAFRCFNLGGIDFMGGPLKKTVAVPAGHVQALWIGVDVPKNASGRYDGAVTIAAHGVPSTTVKVALEVKGDVLSDHGDADAARLARLRWLDSTIGMDDQQVVKPFIPLKREGRRIQLLGRTVEIGDNGLPARIQSFFSGSNTRFVETPMELLAAPMQFEIEGDAGVEPIAFGPLSFEKETPSEITWRAKGQSASFDVDLTGGIEFDGYFDWQLRLTARRDVSVKDVRLVVRHAGPAATYFMGLGQGGRRCPDSLEWRWDTAKFQDAYYVGAVNGGLQLRFKGDNYIKPFVNVYYKYRGLNLPESWGNDNKGGLRLKRGEDQTVAVNVFSGERTLRAGESQLFIVEGLVTPFKLLNTEAQWQERYYHSPPGSRDSVMLDPGLAKPQGATVVNIHHNQEPNPAINYPYWGPSYPLLKNSVAAAHAKDVRLKVYYTLREISSLLPELFAMHSLNGEIIFPGDPKSPTVINPNGAHPWLLEHLREKFIAAWREVLTGRYEGVLDLAVITTPDSRLDNFYLEGLDFLARDGQVDGIYVDDSSIGRKTFQRARRILEARRPAPLIDMHMCRIMFEKQFGHTEPTTVFMENFPYFDRIWPGEFYDYKTFDPATWLLEVSGIPFGVMGEMLQGGGNRWLGMLYGMTTRLGWHGDPQPVWKCWDDFGMQGTEMIGYWDPACPVKTDHPNVLATVYRKEGKALVAIGSWADKPVEVKLSIDWKALGLEPGRVTLKAPEVERFQPARTFAAGDPIPVEPQKGCLLVIERQRE